ncbi:MAG TPA: SDR family NAD(P)-dependent oxidoreductase [Kofleriaceae bacterium]
MSVGTTGSGVRTFRGVHVAITGASSGIGEALARELGAAGARLTLVARREERLHALAAELAAGERSGGSFVAAVDLADMERATSWIQPAEAALGPIDVLVNNAGVQQVAAAADLDAGECEYVLALNVRTPMRLICELLPSMLSRRRGTIVDVASMAAITPMPGMFYYNAAKAALANASEGLRGELRGTGVHVVTVYAGPVDTEMSRIGASRLEDTLAKSLAPMGKPAELARLIRQAIERREPRVIYPRVYSVGTWFPSVSRWCTARWSPAPKRRAGSSPVQQSSHMRRGERRGER